MKKKVHYLLNHAEELISAFFISITVCLVIVNVFFRYVLNIGIYWSEEVATICFVWSVFIGAAACHKKQMHIGIDLLTKFATGKLRQWINLLVHGIMILISGYITYLSIIFVRASAIKPTAVLGISSSYVSVSILIGFGLITLRSLEFLVADVKKMRQMPIS